MRKHLQNAILLLALALTFSAFSQPNLTYTNCTPVIGDQFTQHITNSVSPGSPGANQTWNLSSMVVSASNSASFVSVVSTPSPSFPNANISLKSGTVYAYYKTTTSALQNYNGIASGSIVIPYTNPEDQLHFPLNYTDTYSDSWQGSYTNMSANFIRKGTTTVTADGYGTLTTPAGTYTNILRVHLYTVYIDSITSNGFVFNRVNDEYKWYSNNSHYPIASVYTTTNSSNPTTSGGFYIDNIVNVGIKENIKQDVNVNIYPNPASDQLHLKFSVNSSENTELNILNVQGQLIKKHLVNPQSNFEQSIDISDLSDGIYLLNIKTTQGIKIQKFIVEK